MNSNLNFIVIVYVLEAKTIPVYHTTLAQSIPSIFFYVNRKISILA